MGLPCGGGFLLNKLLGYVVLESIPLLFLLLLGIGLFVLCLEARLYCRSRVCMAVRILVSVFLVLALVS